MSRFIIDTLEEDEKVITVDRTAMEHAPGFAGSVQVSVYEHDTCRDTCVHLSPEQVVELIEALQAHR